MSVCKSLVTGFVCCEDEYSVFWHAHEEVVLHTCVVMWKVFLFWFVLLLDIHIQPYFINSVAVASHPVCPHLNRKLWTQGLVLIFCGQQVEKWWSGCEEEIRCKAELPALCPFLSYLFPVLLLSLYCLLFCRTVSVNHVTLLVAFLFISHTCQNPHAHIPSVIFHASSVPLPVTLTLPMPAVFVLFSAQNISHTLAFTHGDVMTEKCYLVLSGDEGQGKAWKGGNKLRQWVLIVVNKNYFLKNNLAFFSCRPIIELEKD